MEVRKGKKVARFTDLSIDPKYLGGEIAKVNDYSTPFKGIGLGWLQFSSYQGNDYFSKRVGADTQYVLDISLHMDKATEDQAKEVWGKTRKTFGTRFFFGKDGRFAVVSYFPNEVDSKAELIDRNSDDRLKFVKTPFTPSEAEFAGMALQHLMNRVKAENEIVGGSGGSVITTPSKK